MSKTFKSAVTPETHRLTVETINDNQVLLETDSPHVAQAARIAIATAEAPALALAILEAAGFEADINDASSLVNSAMGGLAMHVATEATKAKEVADREALTRRRDDLAREFGSSPLGYADTFDSTQRAIDRVIELEKSTAK